MLFFCPGLYIITLSDKPNLELTAAYFSKIEMSCTIQGASENLFNDFLAGHELKSSNNSIMGTWVGLAMHIFRQKYRLPDSNRNRVSVYNFEKN